MTHQQVDHLIIGAGITGLTLAQRLTKNKQNFLVVEPQHLGGMVRTEIVNGFILETGPNVLLLRPALLSLLKELGLTSEIVYPKISNYQQQVWDKALNTLVSVPKGPKAFIRTNAFSWQEKVNIIKKLFSKKLIAQCVDDLSIGAVLRNLQSEKLVNVFADGGLKGIYGGDIYELSARTIMPNLWEHLRSGNSLAQFIFKSRPASIAMLRSGNQILADTLVSAISTNNIIADRVESLEPNADGCGFNVLLKSGKQILTKRVYITTTGAVTAQFLGEKFLPLKETLANIKFASLAMIHLGLSYKVPLPVDSFGFLIPGKSASGLLGAMFNSQLFPHLAPLNKQLMTVCVGGAGREDLMHKTAADLLDVVRPELKQILGITEYDLLKATAWPQAIPQLNVGYFKINDLFDSFESKFSGLKFIGSDRGGVGVSERIKIAQSCEV